LNDGGNDGRKRQDKELTELLEEYYNGSFPQMACKYICTTRMMKEEVEELLEAMKGSHARV